MRTVSFICFCAVFTTAAEPAESTTFGAKVFAEISNSISNSVEEKVNALINGKGHGHLPSIEEERANLLVKHYSKEELSGAHGGAYSQRATSGNCGSGAAVVTGLKYCTILNGVKVSSQLAALLDDIFLPITFQKQLAAQSVPPLQNTTECRQAWADYYCLQHAAPCYDSTAMLPCLARCEVVIRACYVLPESVVQSTCVGNPSNTRNNSDCFCGYAAPSATPFSLHIATTPSPNSTHAPNNSTSNYSSSPYFKNSSANNTSTTSSGAPPITSPPITTSPSSTSTTTANDGPQIMCLGTCSRSTACPAFPDTTIGPTTTSAAATPAADSFSALRTTAVPPPPQPPPRRVTTPAPRTNAAADHSVAVSMTLPLSLSEFNDTVQDSFKQLMAEAAGLPAAGATDTVILAVRSLYMLLRRDGSDDAALEREGGGLAAAPGTRTAPGTAQVAGLTTDHQVAEAAAEVAAAMAAAARVSAAAATAAMDGISERVRLVAARQGLLAQHHLSIVSPPQPPLAPAAAAPPARAAADAAGRAARRKSLADTSNAAAAASIDRGGGGGGSSRQVDEAGAVAAAEAYGGGGIAVNVTIRLPDAAALDIASAIMTAAGINQRLIDAGFPAASITSSSLQPNLYAVLTDNAPAPAPAPAAAAAPKETQPVLSAAAAGRRPTAAAAVAAAVAAGWLTLLVPLCR